jgi:hypothetical protein
LLWAVTVGQAPATLFAAVEAATLQPLPAKALDGATWSTAMVGPDIHAKVGKTIYSIPWRYLGQRVDARSTATTVQFFHLGQLIATHGRKPQGKQTDLRHSCGEDRVPDADAGLVPHPRRRDRPRLPAGHRRPPAGQRPVPAACRPGRARPGRQAQPGEAGSRLRQGARGR